ncbi:EF-hand and coiled-coil domain-containing protein 1 [Eurytemora carolleeae]|uniref:EF-hand and coiled-coil domain-containing protein 1 n=1 Tax=Eurytemora carolleeae TaxID=1294199 RepID=UPI000C781807|nr:EF-hand and coiled-coil domain-containing protein 1 [Eurytemora carolleeae]|eukprot:XP_023327346.1 EF-hand and coiled-coil domain-containing protein 1-like [Eurytemora affinis]
MGSRGPEHSSSYTPPGWEEDLEKTVSTLTSASRGLSSAQLELRHTALRLKPNTSLNGGHEQTNLERINETLNEEKNMKNYGEKEERRSVERNGDKTKEKEKEKNGKEKGTDEERRNEIIEEAFSALQRAEEEIKHLRLSLEAAQESLEKSRLDLDNSQQEFFNLHTRLKQSENKLSLVEQRSAQLSQNRRSLLCELQSTKEVLLSSLNKVQDLELDSRQVPVLQARVQELERRILVSRRFEGKLRPMSTIDSGLYSTDSTDSDQDPEKTTQGGWEDEGYSVRDQGLPPRPPSSRSRDKSPRSNTPSSGASEKSPRSNTPSSGHHSAGSKLSSSSMQSQNTVSPITGESGISRLRREIETLKKKYNQAEQEWVQERGCLINELSRRKDDFGEISSDLQVLEAERFRLSLLEDKIKEVLNMLRTLNSMRIGQRALGKLVVQAVDQSVDPVLGDIQVFKFLSCLYHSTREYERLAADSMLTRALEAVEGVEDGEEEDESDSDSSESLTNIPEEMGTIRPRRVRVDQPNQTFTIDV